MIELNTGFFRPLRALAERLQTCLWLTCYWHTARGTNFSPPSL